MMEECTRMVVSLVDFNRAEVSVLHTHVAGIYNEESPVLPSRKSNSRKLVVATC